MEPPFDGSSLSPLFIAIPVYLTLEREKKKSAIRTSHIADLKYASRKLEN